MFLGVRAHPQEHLGAGDFALDRLCGERSNGDLETGGSSRLAAFLIVHLGEQDLVHDFFGLEGAAPAAPARIGATPFLNLVCFGGLP